MRAFGAVWLLITTVGCEGAPPAETAIWTLQAPSDVRQPGRLGHPALTESSGVEVSRQHPGILWTHNDSGNPPWIFATDTLGRPIGLLDIGAVSNTDWEDIALGPCGDVTCIYLADVGDNAELRPEVVLHRFPESGTLPDGPIPVEGTVVQSLRVTYPDRPRDVEAVFVAPDGAVHLISKGRREGIVHYVVRASAWTPSGTLPVRAELRERLPLTPTSNAQLVTGAALALDGRRVAIRTYAMIYLFELTPDGGLVPYQRRVCSIGATEQLGEGIAWWDDTTLLLTSESGPGGQGRITLLKCGPPPPRPPP